MKKTLTVLFVIIALFVGFNIKAQATKSLYPNTLIIDEVNREKDIVTGRTVTGLLYSFTGCDDWMVGDIAAVIMHDNNTPDTITDDIIINIRYTGYTD